MVDQAQLQLQYQIYCMLLNQHSAQQGSPFAEWLAMVVIDHLLVQLPSFRYLNLQVQQDLKSTEKVYWCWWW